VIAWDPSGNSFFIGNVEKFVRILPQYFKTKNFASFIRQLNMYDFHKVKNSKGMHEFRHEQFRKGYLEGLKHIKRKNNEVMEQMENIKTQQTSLRDEYLRMQESIKNLEETIDLVNSHRDSMVDMNKNLVGQIYFLKAENELKMRKLFYVFFVLLKYYSGPMISFIQSSLRQTDFSVPKEEIASQGTPQSIINSARQFGRLFCGQTNITNSYVDKLVEIFSNFLKIQTKNEEPDSLVNLDDFVKQLVSDGISHNGKPTDADAKGCPFMKDKFVEIDNDSNFDRDSLFNMRVDRMSELNFIDTHNKTMSFTNSILGQDESLNESFSSMRGPNFNR
jgi:hypothetical protein